MIMKKLLVTLLSITMLLGCKQLAEYYGSASGGSIEGCVYFLNDETHAVIIVSLESQSDSVLGSGSDTVRAAAMENKILRSTTTSSSGFFSIQE